MPILDYPLGRQEWRVSEKVLESCGKGRTGNHASHWFCEYHIDGEESLTGSEKEREQLSRKIHYENAVLAHFSWYNLKSSAALRKKKKKDRTNINVRGNMSRNIVSLLQWLLKSN